MKPGEIKAGEILYHKATAEPMVVLSNTAAQDSVREKQVYVSRLSQGENGSSEYELAYFYPEEFETFEERAARERDMQKFLFSLSNPPKGPQQIN